METLQTHSTTGITILNETIISCLRPVPFRGKSRLLGPLCPQTGSRTIRLFGFTVTLDLSDYIQRQIYLGTFEPAESRITGRWLRPGMTFVDVGANVGYFTLLASSLVGARGRVLAMEPGPYAFKRLSATLSSNAVKQAYALPIGLSDAEAVLDLYEPKGKGNYTPTMVPNCGGAPCPVQVRPFDLVAAELAISQVDLMKIDVEGHEGRVLAGADRMIREGRIRAILCEFNDHWLRRTGSSATLLMQRFRDLGFVDSRAAEPLDPGRVESRLLYLP